MAKKSARAKGASIPTTDPVDGGGTSNEDAPTTDHAPTTETTPETERIEVDDVVYLHSGSPPLTVLALEGDMARVEWETADGSMQQSVYSLSALTSHGADAPAAPTAEPVGIRTAQILHDDGNWFDSPYDEILAGDVYRFIEADGSPVDGVHATIVSRVYHLPGGGNAIEGFPVFLVEPAPEDGGDPPLPPSLAILFDDGAWHGALATDMEDGVLFFIGALGEGEKPEASNTHTAAGPAIRKGRTWILPVHVKPTDATPASESAADDIDPIEASLQEDVPPGLPEELLTQIRGLWATGYQILAIIAYRNAITPTPTLGEAKRATEAIVSSGPAPENFVPPTDLPPPTEEDNVVHIFPDQGTPDPERVEKAMLRTVPKPPPAPPRTGRGIIGKRRSEASVELTEIEFHARAHRLAMIHDEISDEKGEQSKAKAAMKDRLSALEGERAKLSAIVRDRKEVRTVDVLLEADFSEGLVREVRCDTNEIVNERPITPDERQVPLFNLDEQETPTPTQSEDWFNQDEDRGADPDDDNET